jgi:chromosome segregation ATPase
MKNKDELDQTQGRISTLEQQRTSLENQIQELQETQQVLTTNLNEVSRVKHQLELAAEEAMRRVLDNSLLPDPREARIEK